MSELEELKEINKSLISLNKNIDEWFNYFSESLNEIKKLIVK